MAKKKSSEELEKSKAEEQEQLEKSKADTKKEVAAEDELSGHISRERFK